MWAQREGDIANGSFILRASLLLTELLEVSSHNLAFITPTLIVIQ
jgi:hypothetical protein